MPNITKDRSCAVVPMLIADVLLMAVSGASYLCGSQALAVGVAIGGACIGVAWCVSEALSSEAISEETGV